MLHLIIEIWVALSVALVAGVFIGFLFGEWRAAGRLQSQSAAYQGRVSRVEKERDQLRSELDAAQAHIEQLERDIAAQVSDVKATETVAETLKPALSDTLPATREDLPIAQLLDVEENVLTQLQAEGIHLASDLRRETLQAEQRLALAEKLQVSSGEVENWRAAVELICLPRLSAAQVCLLVEAGVDGLDALASAAPETLAEQLRQINQHSAHLDEADLSDACVASWVEAAAQQIATRLVADGQ